MLGAVMAGGSGQRLGRDKAEVLLAAEPLWRRQAHVLQQAGATRIVLLRRPDQPAPQGIECWRDEFTDAGPLAGLHAALARGMDETVAVLAVDMPGITSEWFLFLKKFCRPGAGAMVQHGEICEPLAAIYPREALSEVTSRLQRRELSLQRLSLALAAAGRMTQVPASAADLMALRSVNRAEDLAFWQSASAMKTPASVSAGIGGEPFAIEQEAAH